jgi:hypothetical protein
MKFTKLPENRILQLYENYSSSIFSITRENSIDRSQEREALLKIKTDVLIGDEGKLDELRDLVLLCLKELTNLAIFADIQHETYQCSLENFTKFEDSKDIPWAISFCVYPDGDRILVTDSINMNFGTYSKVVNGEGFLYAWGEPFINLLKEPLKKEGIEFELI